MINYSLVLRGNPSDQDADKKAYAAAQYSSIMNLNQFSRHISSHGCVYSRADIQAILTLAVDCIREQLLLGQRIQLGELGTFYVSLKSRGETDKADFTTANIKAVNVSFSPGTNFVDLIKDAEFNYVLTREEQAKVLAESKKMPQNP